MPIAGAVFVWGLHWDGQKWANGEVLDVRDSVTQGIVANCEIEMSSVDSVRIYGWLFHRWLGKGSEWTRVKP